MEVGGLWCLGKFLGGNVSTTAKQFIPFHFTTGTIAAVLFVCIFFLSRYYFSDIFACFVYFATCIIVLFSYPRSSAPNSLTAY